MTQLSEMLQETTQFILEKGVKEIDFGLILGSGLGELAEEIEEAIVIPYDQIPFFPTSTVVGHAGQLVYGTLSGKKVLAMQGRFHFYEGHSMQTHLSCAGNGSIKGSFGDCHECKWWGK